MPALINKTMSLLSKIKTLFLLKTLKVISVIFLFIFLIVIFYPFSENYFSIPHYKNITIEVLREIIIQNDESNNIVAGITISNSTPQVMNYKFKLLKVETNIKPYKTNNNSIFYQLTIPGHDRVFFTQKYYIALYDQLEINPSIVSCDKITPDITTSNPAPVKISNKIYKLTKQITSGYSDNYSKAREIFKYIINHMRYTYNYKYAHKGSLSALSTGRGLCEDYASLFVAMAQSVSIPCRYNDGFRISSLNNHYEVLDSCGHAWPEIRLKNGKWLPIEATQNELPVRFAINLAKFNLNRAFKNLFGIYLYIDLNEKITYPTDKKITTQSFYLIRKVPYIKSK